MEEIENKIKESGAKTGVVITIKDGEIATHSFGVDKLSLISLLEVVKHGLLSGGNK